MQQYDIKITSYNNLHFLYKGITTTDYNDERSKRNKQTNNTVDNQPHEEVDYADPESPTLAIRQLTSPTTGPKERQTDRF